MSAIGSALLEVAEGYRNDASKSRAAVIRLRDALQYAEQVST
jgi:hypothetical protein